MSTVAEHLAHLRMIAGPYGEMYGLRQNDQRFQFHATLLCAQHLDELEALANAEKRDLRRGIHALADVVSNLLQTGRYVDEEGEETAALWSLLRTFTISGAPAGAPTEGEQQ